MALGFACFVALALAVGEQTRAAEDDPAKAQPAAGADQSFDGQIKTAWQALANRDVAAAKTAIADATKQAADTGQKKEVAQMQFLAGSVEQFWRDVDAELKKLQAGDELEIAGTKIAVVESKPDSLTLHIEGKTKKKSRAALPGRWAQAVAEHRLDLSSPANKRKLGAFLAVDPQGDRDEARQLWKAAQRGEPAAGELLSLLDNANIPAASKAKDIADDDSGHLQLGTMPLSGEPVNLPSKDKVTAAVKRVKETYAAEIRGAKSPDRKLELSKTLVKEASADGDDEAWRLALLRQALDLAAVAGNIDAMEEVVDVMKQRFKIDVWEVKAEALTRGVAAAKAPAVGDLVRHAVVLLEEHEAQAGAAKKAHAKAAQKLDQAALAAAQKARDPELVSTLMDRKKQSSAESKN
ncbi:MAG TPA: hypothetical protein VHY91_02395 [Pirellulales bacterium]|jgi:hypothetical protein|nr:hypothetical protein [Pirellulales bacterium]